MSFHLTATTPANVVSDVRLPPARGQMCARTWTGTASVPSRCRPCSVVEAEPVGNRLFSAYRYLFLIVRGGVDLQQQVSQRSKVLRRHLCL